MRKSIIIFILALILNTSLAFENLNKGVGLADEILEAQLFKTSIPYAIARQGQRSINTSSVQSYMDLGDSVYSISSNLEIIQTKSTDRSVLGQWPLTRWLHQYVSPTTLAQYQELFLDYPRPFDYESVGPGIGCYGDAPLRYGDIENDAKNELVIILNGLFMVFSLEHKQVVFAEYLDASDWFDAEEELEFFGDKEITTSQFVSRLMAENDRVEPGVRVYAKLYLGDYDKDGNNDILVWRKAYLSNEVSNPVIGFTKQSDNWQHFERSTDVASAGQYLPQVTDAETIKGWLSADQLTWKNGYPSQTECVGQQGLIPEMHDVLLNDPEVLR